MKDRVREALITYELWRGGNLATQQDMCALFWARGAERYIKHRGRLAFVLPFAVLNAPVFVGMRGGRLGQTRVRVTGAWSLERVWPIFGAQSGSSTTSTCVLFGRRQMPGNHPDTVDRWEGKLPRRDADEDSAALALVHSKMPWPRERTLIGRSPYRERFKNGATIYPRRFFIVEPERATRLGTRRDAPRVRGRAGALDNPPWTTVDPPHGPVEVPAPSHPRGNDSTFQIAAAGAGRYSAGGNVRHGLGRRGSCWPSPLGGLATRCRNQVERAEQ
jgi:hypothetical protein